MLHLFSVVFACVRMYVCVLCVCVDITKSVLSHIELWIALLIEARHQKGPKELESTTTRVSRSHGKPGF